MTAYKFSSLFSAIALTSAFDESIEHQAKHGRVAHVFVRACALEFVQPANEKTGVKAQALIVPETKVGFDKFSNKFIACPKLGAGKAKAYPITVKQGQALLPALAAIREGLGLPSVDVGQAWVIVPKVKTPSTPEAPTAPDVAPEGTTAPDATTEATTAPDATTEATTAPDATTEAATAPPDLALELMGESPIDAVVPDPTTGMAHAVVDFVKLITAGAFTIQELQYVMDACMMQAESEGYTVE